MAAPSIQQALALHRQGQLDQAAALYTQILDREPADFGALQFLGVLRGQQGRYAEALRLIEAALKIRPQDFGALGNYGQTLMTAGRLPEALAAFDRALAVRPDFFEALYNRATVLAQMKRFAEAVGIFDKALMHRPNSAASFYNRALAQAELGRNDEALASYDQALRITPGFAEALDNRGNLLRAMGRCGEALESYEKAIALQPRNFRTHYNRAIALSDLKRDEEAAASYEQALAIEPDFFEAQSNLGVVLLKLKRFSEALQSFDKAAALRADDIEMLNNRGTALWHLGRKVEARASYDHVLSARRGHTGALLNRAFLLQELGETEQALADYAKVIADEPDNARAWNGRGATLQALKRDGEALADFEKAVSLDPSLADALANRGLLKWTQNGDQAGAVTDLEAALALDPAQPYARGQLLHVKMFGADWEDFDAEKAVIDEGVRNGQRVVSPFVYQALSDSPADLQACSRIFTNQFFPCVEQAPPFFHSHDRIRIGYVSGEFREQATAYLMAELYELHDRRKFEVIAIDNGGSDGSPMRRRLEAAFDRLVYINQLSDAEAAARIRAEEIDILVNLNGYFGAPRTGVFQRRAAPVQVNYLGFPATLGAPYMDYIIADRTVIPDEHRRFYDEQVVWLPHSYQVNDRKRTIAPDVPDRAALGLPEHGVVFCNFNQSYKLTPDVFAAWMRILKAVDGSVLWLLNARPPFQANLSREAERHGVAAERLVFAPSLPLERHLARLKQADLFLDSLPYNAHTTASDALWAGMPLVTVMGTSFPGRVAASLLAAIGMPELVTRTIADYEKLAIHLASDNQALATIRQRLAENRFTTPLFDTDLFRKHLESAYTTMWQTWKNGEAAKGFAVEPLTEPLPG
ncbi:MAG TPA: tetratricopeptide repeat protein [Rhizomicrobium sp.]|jgi:predicted O-linked N-acetylglucosamine transferase (SPINDLY family)